MTAPPNQSAATLANGPGSGHRTRLALTAPLRLDCGIEISDFPVAYQTYGTLDAERSNAFLVCHALTGDQFVAEPHPLTDRPGWWDVMVGPGKVIDTDRFFVICANVRGGCLGTTGPMDIEQRSGKPYGLSFPVITIGDMVRVQKRLIDHLGIAQLFLVTGGSMGALQVLECAARYPEAVFAAMPIAGAARHSAQNIAFHEVGRQAVMADPDWHDGDYFHHDSIPRRGLAVARMAAHITYLSEAALHRKFRSEEHTSELQSRRNLVCRLLLAKKKKQHHTLDVTSTLQNCTHSSVY